MRVLLISDTEAKGGAAIAAARMACALGKAGHEVGMVVNDPQEGLPAGPWQRYVVRAEESIPWNRVPDASLEAEALGGLERTLNEFSPDAVSVHNIHGGARVGWSVDLVRLCAGRVPTVWTLHDTWSFTGRCAYLDGCSLFRDGCDERCPTTGEYPFLRPGGVSAEFSRKAGVLRVSPGLAAAAPSRWMAELAACGLWRGREVRLLPNCLDTAAYAPGDRAEARRALGLAVEGRVLLLCAANFGDPRKGVGMAREALKRLGAPLTLLVMGRADDLPDLPGVTVKRLGFVADQARQIMAYRAADAMLHPALQDNLPNTVLESLACGTPVAGFDVGGMGDLVLDGLTGRLAASVTPEGLAEAAIDCLERSETLGAAGRAHVLEQFSEAWMAARWTALIQTLQGGAA
ncbi:glycosyltransferase [Pseudodesulfovibrio methanolicus]|uniref:Glycosyltransferase n=1 Tax=Pseudodesulfovibrio methanolicus TaxID=3126690 RepID=A0ABZ2J0S3_9BACT